MMFDVAFPVVVGEASLDSEAFDRAYGSVQLYDSAFCLGRVVRIVEPLPAVGIEVADVLFLRILYASIESCRRIIKRHSWHCIECSRTEDYVSAGSCVFRRGVVAVAESEYVGAEFQPWLHSDVEV